MIKSLRNIFRTAPTPAPIPAQRFVRVGEVLPSSLYGDFKVLSIDITGETHKLTIRFLNTDNTRIVDKDKAFNGDVTDTALCRGYSYKAAKANNDSTAYKAGIDQPSKPTVYGVGTTGYGKYAPDTHKRMYATWVNMLGRKYSSKAAASPRKTNFVDGDWYDFQAFGDWYTKHYQTGFWMLYLGTGHTATPETVMLVPVDIHRAIGRKMKPEQLRKLLVPYYKANKLSAEQCRRLMDEVF